MLLRLYTRVITVTPWGLFERILSIHIETCWDAKMLLSDMFNIITCVRVVLGRRREGPGSSTGPHVQMVYVKRVLPGNFALYERLTRTVSSDRCMILRWSGAIQNYWGMLCARFGKSPISLLSNQIIVLPRETGMGINTMQMGDENLKRSDNEPAYTTASSHRLIIWARSRHQYDSF